MYLIVKGLQNTWRLKKFIAILWVINFFVAGLFIMPYWGNFRDFFSNRMVTDILADQNIYTYYAEFYYRMDSAVSSSLVWIQLGNLIHYLVFIFLTGGFISVLVVRGEIYLKKFWKDCLKFGPKMLIIGLITPVLLGFLLLIGFLMGLPFTFLLPDYFVEDQYFYFLIFMSVLIFILILGGLLVIDLVKIKIIERKDQNMGRLLLEVLSLFLQYPLRFFGHYLVIFLVWLTFVAAYWLLQHHLSDRSAGGMLIELLLLQAAILGQIWIRFSRYDILLRLLQDIGCESDLKKTTQVSQEKM